MGVFRICKLLRKVCVSWVLSLNKRVGVSACKIRMPDTHVFVPTLHKSFLDDLLESKEISTNLLIQGKPSNCGKGHMQPYSSKKAKRVAWILRSRSRKQLKRIKLTENVAFIVWFVRIKLDNKVKMQLSRHNQAKRVVPITYHPPITKNLVYITSRINLNSPITYIKLIFMELSRYKKSFGWNAYKRTGIRHA